MSTLNQAEPAVAPLWARNMLFGLTVVGGIVILFVSLMSTRRVVSPSTFNPAGKSQSEIRQVALGVDDAIYRQWKDQSLQIQVAGRADDLTIARRLSLGLSGVLPSVEEIREFEKQPQDQRIHWMVSRLLEDRRTSYHLAERFARALIGVDEGPFVLYRRRRFVQWLSNQLYENRPYDALVRQLLTGEGLWTDAPEVNFFTKTIADTEQPDPIVLAGRTSRAFLGMRIDCLQCHDDFLGTINLGSESDPTGGMQMDFHSLASFFGDTEVSLLGIKENSNRDTYKYKLLDEEDESEIEPVVPFNRELDANEDNLRVRLANWVTHPKNRPFARATVNRMWAIMSGRPLVEPVDDIPLVGPFPAAMESLVDDFVANGFDLQRLIRVIAETEAFQRASDGDFEITTLHEEQWSVFPMTRLRPDQVGGAIVQSTSLTTIDSTSHIITQLTRFGQQNDFIERFGDPGEDEFLARGETVTQRLLMLNGDMIGERIDNGLGSPVRIGVVSPSLEKAIETVYLSTLCRRPSEEELRHFTSEIEPLPDTEQNTRLQDLYWTLINSLEFAWNH